MSRKYIKRLYFARTEIKLFSYTYDKMLKLETVTYQLHIHIQKLVLTQSIKYFFIIIINEYINIIQKYSFQFEYVRNINWWSNVVCSGL